MMFRRALLLAAVASLGASLAAQQQQAQKPDSKAADPDVLVLKPPPPPPGQQQKPALRAVDLQSRPKLDDVTKMRLIQLLDADLVHTRKYLPLGDKNTKITPEGLVTPNDSALFQSMQAHGAAAKVGDKVQITNIVFHEKSVYVETNGGPKKKSKWYQHISISGAGGGVAAPDDPNAAQPTGAAVTLEFNKYVPEMNGDELQKLLSPVLDFSVKSAAEVYIETMPPKIREAMKKHEVLVGMNKDMVIMAMDRPQQKVREKDESGKEYEEWIYGDPPQDVDFVRFNGDEVVRVETMKVNGEKTLRTEKEVDLEGATAVAKSSPASEEMPAGGPSKPPSLRRPGEAPEIDTPTDGPDRPQRPTAPPVGPPQLVQNL